MEGGLWGLWGLVGAASDALRAGAWFPADLRAPASWGCTGTGGNAMCLLGSVHPQTRGLLLLATLP